VGDVVASADFPAALAGIYPLQCLGLLVVSQLRLRAKLGTLRLGGFASLVRPFQNALALVFGKERIGTRGSPDRSESSDSGAGRVLA
jgi:hypothetical protein